MNFPLLLSRFLRRTPPQKPEPPNSYQNNPWQEIQDTFMRSCFARPEVAITGVLHVGGHLGEEYTLYRSFGAKSIIFFEPVPKFFAELQKRVGDQPGVVLVPKALGAESETKQLYVNRGNGESTSFMKPTKLYDGFFESETLPIEIDTLDSFLDNFAERNIYNTLVVDTQGFDLEVLKGATRSLPLIDHVYTEVSKGHYCGEPTLDEFDSFLNQFGFNRVETSMYGSWKGEDEWGDIFYTRTSVATR